MSVIHDYLLTSSEDLPKLTLIYARSDTFTLPSSFISTAFLTSAAPVAKPLSTLTKSSISIMPSPHSSSKAMIVYKPSITQTKCNAVINFL